MTVFLDRPFQTDDFSLKGAGVDFLGLRLVNLRILDEQLLPGINNATEDFGVYCLGAWIPWKFKSLCTDQGTLKQFNKFRQAVEVAMSFVTRDESKATQKFGSVHRKIGARQKLKLPSILDFERVQRTESTSIYAAPLYGPSLRYLGLAGRAMAADGTATEIWANADDPDTTTLVNAVEEGLTATRSGRGIDELAVRKFEAKELDELGIRGLHPASCRFFSRKVRLAFLAKLLPKDVGHRRTLSAQLIIRTLQSTCGIDVVSMRHLWHCGLLREGKQHRFDDPELALHRDRWRMLMVRQYQRYILEELLRCFEVAVKNHCRTLPEITQHALRDQTDTRAHKTLREIFYEEAAPISRSCDIAAIAERWAVVVHREHPSYIDAISLEENGEGCGPALRMLTRWWLGSMSAVMAHDNHELASLGGEDRISMRWFLKWVEARLDLPLQQFVREVFEQLVFAQHVRIALSRFDGRHQRLRFVLGDTGIEPTRSKNKKLAEGIPGWMADRLPAFVNLLSDLSVLESDDSGRLQIGPLADAVIR